METTKRVLELLYDRREGFFAAGELAAAAGIDRDRLEGELARLRRAGQRIELCPGCGVRLRRPARPDAHLIERRLGTRRLGRHVICFDEVDSTNDVAFDSARQADADGLVVLAEFQRRGRGRLGRRWISAPGQSILLSALRIDAGGKWPHEAVTIAAGLGVAEGIEDACGLVGQLEWPNDVMLEAKKLAGILVEVRTVGGDRAVVIGAGINADGAPGEPLDRPATSLAEHLGHPVERIEVIRSVLRRLDDWMHRVEAGRLDELHAAWISRCGMLNTRIEVVCDTGRYVGRVLDVSPLEGLILACDDGRNVRLAAESSTVLK